MNNLKYNELSSKENALYKVALKVKALKVKDEVLVEGTKLIQEAIQNGYLLLDLFVSETEWLEKNNNLVHFFKSNNPQLKIYVLKKELFNALSFNTTPGQVIGWFKKVDFPKYNLRFEKGATLLLDSLQDPGNVGTIIRTAQALGIKAIFLHNCVNLNNHKLIKAAMGASFYSNVFTITNLEPFLKEVKQKEIKLIGSFLDEKTVDLNTVDFKKLQKLMLVVGNEGHGILPLINDYCDYKIKIPMQNHMESLNVAVATGIILYYVLNNLH